MTSQNPEKSNVAGWDFLRMRGTGLVVYSTNALGTRRRSWLRDSPSTSASLASARGTACIRHELSACPPDLMVDGLC